MQGAYYQNFPGDFKELLRETKNIANSLISITVLLEQIRDAERTHADRPEHSLGLKDFTDEEIHNEACRRRYVPVETPTDERSGG